MKNLTYMLLFFLLLSSCSKEDDNIEEPIPDDYTYEFTKFKQTHTYNGTNTVIPYHLFEPQQANNSNNKFPLIVTLHGTEYHLASEENFLAYFPSNYMATAWIEEAKQKKFPTYVVAPNLHDPLWDIDGYNSWEDVASQDYLNELIENLLTSYQIDSNRVYFVGHSIGGGAMWKLNQTLKSKAAAIIPLSHALGPSEAASSIIDDISNGVYDDISIWTIVHVSDNEGSTRTARPIFEYLQDNNYSPVITNTLGDQVFELTNEEIESEINVGKSYFYTENRESPCEHGGGCHYSWITQLEGDLIYRWLFRQQKND